jgi:hypothetical protein
MTRLTPQQQKIKEQENEVRIAELDLKSAKNTVWYAERRVEEQKEKLKVMKAEELTEDEELFILRHYDGFDNIWIDVTSPASKKATQFEYNQHTDNGSKNTCYEDIDYYKIFPENTRMLRS